MDPSLISLAGQLGGTGVSIGLIIWLVILILRQLQAGRTMDKDSLGERISGLKEQVEALTEKVTSLERLVEQERGDRIRAEEREAFLRRILIDQGLGEKLP